MLDFLLDIVEMALWSARTRVEVVVALMLAAAVLLLLAVCVAA